MKVSMVIRGGMVVDPATETERIASVILSGKKIVGICECGQEPQSDEVVDATGCIVMPGLIDSHCHVFYEGTENGVDPDVTMLPMGITACIDQGSAGSGNFRAFYNSVIARSRMHIFATLNISTQGLVTSSYPENLTDKSVNLPAIKELFEEYRDILCGIKVRISKELVGDLGLNPLKNALKAAEIIGTRIAVHPTNPPVPVNDFICMFRKGDILAHTYAKREDSILGTDGKVLTEVWKARKRGVIFDSSDARVHYSFPVIKEAYEEGFYPDTISTDLVQGSLFKVGVFGLPRVMSKHLALGMSLREVVRAVTAKPAEILGQKGKLGTLEEGAAADVAIFKYEDAPTVMVDREDNALEIEKQLIPQCTILGGKIVYRDFNF